MVGHGGAVTHHDERGRAGVGQITLLLADWSEGNTTALTRLIQLVYPELSRVARVHLSKERQQHRLLPAELVHEAFLRLAQQDATLQNRSHFFAVASMIMRRILVKHARNRLAQKRGGLEEHLPFVDDDVGEAPVSVRVLDLDEAMIELHGVSPRQSRIVELRFFGGLRVEEVAEVLDLSPRTVKREWQAARAFLRSRLGESFTPVDPG
jgi:RNA polymerase sigma factor (TIGR02999 family)